jgi:hypothetical protein
VYVPEKKFAVNREPLDKEIYRAASRQFARIFARASYGRDVKNFPRLAGITEQLEPDAWRADPHGAFVSLMREAVSNLSGAVTGMSTSWSIFGELLYGFRDDEMELRENGEPQNYKSRHAHAIKTYGDRLPDRTASRLAGNLHKRMAGELGKRMPSPVAMPREQPVVSAPSVLPAPITKHGEVEYVSRPELEASVEAWLASGVRVLILIGDSGNGKSRLAREVLKRQCNTSDILFVRVNASSRAAIESSLMARCAEFGVTPLGSQFVSLFYALKKTGKNFTFLLDDVPEWNDVRDFVDAEVPLVITSWTNIVPREVEHYEITVRALKEDQARTLVGRFPIATNAQDVGRFLAAIGRKPRVIIDCLSAFEHPGLSLADLCDQLERQPHIILASLSRSERSLVNAYQLLLIQLDASDPHSALLLRIMVNTGDTYIYREVLQDIFETAVELEDVGYPDGEFKRCLYVLDQRLHFSTPSSSLELNKMTHAIFVELTHEFSSRSRALVRSAYRRRQLQAQKEQEEGRNTPTALALHKFFGGWPDMRSQASFYWDAYISGASPLSDGCMTYDSQEDRRPEWLKDFAIELRKAKR